MNSRVLFAALPDLFVDCWTVFGDVVDESHIFQLNRGVGIGGNGAAHRGLISLERAVCQFNAARIVVDGAARAGGRVVAKVAARDSNRRIVGVDGAARQFAGVSREFAVGYGCGTAFYIERSAQTFFGFVVQ